MNIEHEEFDDLAFEVCTIDSKLVDEAEQWLNDNKISYYLGNRNPGIFILAKKDTVAFKLIFPFLDI